MHWSLNISLDKLLSGPVNSLQMCLFELALSDQISIAERISTMVCSSLLLTKPLTDRSHEGRRQLRTTFACHAIRAHLITRLQHAASYVIEKTGPRYNCRHLLERALEVRDLSRRRRIWLTVDMTAIQNAMVDKAGKTVLYPDFDLVKIIEKGRSHALRSMRSSWLNVSLSIVATVISFKPDCIFRNA